MKALVSLFQGPNGDVSSKRFFAFVCLGEAIWKANGGGDFQSVALWLGMAGGLLGVQAFTKT